MPPLHGIRVLDFSTLLPGPMATLFLAEAGAEVIKIERPGSGDDMRHYQPKVGPETDSDSVNFAMLNRGKRSLTIDLKSPDAINQLRPLIESADVLIEQFRPGVMDRLGLGYEALSKINPRLIYCAITGYGQNGPKRDEAGHDLNYIASTGLLGLSAGPDGAPIVPPALIADIAGGTYPAVLNILLALRQRDQTGQGCYLDIAMSDHIFPFMYWALGSGQVAGQWPKPGGELVTGGSPRYQIYRTEDNQFVATAPLEQKFWDNFCALIELAPELRDDSSDPKATMAAVADIIRQHPAAHWQECFQGRDVCCNVAQTLEAAMADPHFQARGLFEPELELTPGKSIHATPVPIAAQFRAHTGKSGFPGLGEATEELLAED